MTASFTLLVLSSKDRGASSPSILYPKEESGSHCLLILDLKPRSAGLKFGSTIMANKEIADRLCLSIHTVTTHRRNLSAKLGIHSPAGLTIFAILHHLVDLKDVNPHQ